MLNELLHKLEARSFINQVSNMYALNAGKITAYFMVQKGKQTCLKVIRK